jgi:hypothetical protein
MGLIIWFGGGTRKDMSRTTALQSGHWVKAVNELMAASHLSVAGLAETADVAGPTMSRWLGRSSKAKNQRQPTADDVKLINVCVGHLLNDEHNRIAQYLNACYWLDNVPDAREAAMEAYGLVTEGALAYLRPEAREEISSLLNAMPSKAFHRLVVAVNAMYRRRLLPHLLNRPEPAKSLFEETCDIFRRHRIDLARWLRPRNEIEEQLQTDLFRSRVRDALRTILSTLATLAGVGEIPKASAKRRDG